MFTFKAEVFVVERLSKMMPLDQYSKVSVTVHAETLEKAKKKIEDLLPAPPRGSDWHVDVIEIEEILNAVFVS